VLLSKHAGATVTAVVSTPNIAVAKGLGADSVVDDRDVPALAALHSGGPQFDLIYDTVSSFAPEDPDYLPTSMLLLNPGGRWVPVPVPVPVLVPVPA
jgi:NADPH:quinone reductase-like Zn-dependent oxidoreductase